MPNLAKNVMTRGSSKTSPNARSNLAEKLKYSFIDGRGCMVSEANPKKNLKPNGKTIKYPNSAPPTKKTEDKKTIGTRKRLSFLYNPGATNIQNWYRTTGAASIKPDRRETFK